MADNDNRDIRWQQCFVHFQKAFDLLDDTLTISEP